MTDTDKTLHTEQQTTITIKRVFNLPVAIVWKAWTDSASLKKWWGPGEYTCPAFNIDFKVDGEYVACMKAKADGKETWTTGTYIEVIPGSKIVFTDSLSDSDGNVVDGSYYGVPEMPLQLLITVELEEITGKTSMTMQQTPLPVEMADDCIKGWQSSFDKLEANVK